MNLGSDTSDFSPEDEDDQDTQRQAYAYEVSRLDREEILTAVLNALESPSSPLYALIDDELGYPTLPDENVKHNALEWQKIGKAMHTIVASQIQAKVQVGMAVERPID